MQSQIVNFPEKKILFLPDKKLVNVLNPFFSNIYRKKKKIVNSNCIKSVLWKSIRELNQLI